MAQSSFLPFTRANLVLVNRIYFWRSDFSISLAVEESSGESRYIDVGILRDSRTTDNQRAVSNRSLMLRFIAEVFAAMKDMNFDQLDWTTVPQWAEEMMDKKEIRTQKVVLSRTLQLPAHIIEIIKLFQYITGMVFREQPPNSPGGDMLFIGEPPRLKTPTD